MSGKIRVSNLVTLLTILFITTSISAQTLQEATILSQKGLFYDARALGMGNAHSTLNQNYSALLFNPATLGIIDRFTFSGSINANAMVNKASYYGTDTRFTSTSGSLSQFGFSIPIEFDSTRNVVLAFGYTQPTDFNYALQFEGINPNNTFIANTALNNDELSKRLGLIYPSELDGGGYTSKLTNGLNQQGYILSEGTLNKWSVGGAFEFAPNVYFGTSINYNIGSVIFDSEIIEEDINNQYGEDVLTNPNDPITVDFKKSYRHQIKEWNYNGWDAKFGLLYKMWNFISLGGSIKLPTKFNIVQDNYVRGYADFKDNIRRDTTLISPETEYTIETPFEYTFSAAVNVWLVRASAEITYIDYSQMKFNGDLDRFEQSDLNKQIKNDFTGVVNLNGGAEIDIPWTGISGRAGFILQPSPYDQEDMDYARKYLTTGLGFTSGEETTLEVSLAYAYGWWDAQQQTYEDDLANTKQSIQRHNGMLTFTLRF